MWWGGGADSLFNHLPSSGITRDSDDAIFWEPERPFPDEHELKEIVRDGHLVVPRDERFKYSNIGFGVLGSVIAEVSGQPFEDFVRSAVLEPLGLTDTGTDVSESHDLAIATGYGPSFFDESRRAYPAINTGALASATGFLSTVHDLCEFAAAHFFDDDRLLSNASKRDMQKVQWRLPIDGQDYASGFDLVKVGDRHLLGHRGAFSGFMSCTRFDPVDRLVVSVAINGQDGPARLLAESVFGILNFFMSPDLPARAASESVSQVRRFSSRLFSPWGVTDFVPVGTWLTALDPREVDRSAHRCSCESQPQTRSRSFTLPAMAAMANAGRSSSTKTTRSSGENCRRDVLPLG